MNGECGRRMFWLEDFLKINKRGGLYERPKSKLFSVRPAADYDLIFGNA